MPTPAVLARGLAPAVLARGLAPAVLAGALALGAGACADAVTPVPPMTSPPSTTTVPGAMGDGGGSGMPGGMMGDRTATPATSHTGPVAGEDLDPTAASALQAAVEQGSQPWRLDPQMTAVAFARARLGWMMARPLRTAPDTVVLDGGRGGGVSVHVVQPARAGTGGIWAITGGTWMR